MSSREVASIMLIATPTISVERVRDVEMLDSMRSTVIVLTATDDSEFASRSRWPFRRTFRRRRDIGTTLQMSASSGRAGTRAGSAGKRKKLKHCWWESFSRKPKISLSVRGGKTLTSYRKLPRTKFPCHCFIGCARCKVLSGRRRRQRQLPLFQVFF